MELVDYDPLDALAQKLMANHKAHVMRERGFIYRHGRRVARGVILLREAVTPNTSQDDALRVAAMFHDVGKGIEPHEQSGAALARAFLAPYFRRSCWRRSWG